MRRGLVVLNTDGSVQADGSKAAAGGLIRNSEGRYLHAFCTNLGKCSIMRAELRGIIIGLQIAWENGFRKVDARIDSQAILTLIKDNESATHQHVVDIADLQELLNVTGKSLFLTFTGKGTLQMTTWPTWGTTTHGVLIRFLYLIVI
ncbi:Putative ribonuclease H protein At1g65750 [Linum perenne]